MAFAPTIFASVLLAATPYAYTKPFIQPLPVWDIWWVLLIPLLLAVAIVYKAIRVPDLSRLPREAGVLFLWFFLGMSAAAIFLAALVRFLER